MNCFYLAFWVYAFKLKCLGGWTVACLLFPAEERPQSIRFGGRRVLSAQQGAPWSAVGAMAWTGPTKIAPNGQWALGVLVAASALLWKVDTMLAQTPGKSGTIMGTQH